MGGGKKRMKMKKGSIKRKKKGKKNKKGKKEGEREEEEEARDRPIITAARVAFVDCASDVRLAGGSVNACGRALSQ